MEISLVRHGKSAWTDNTKVSGQNFKKWVIHYDLNGVLKERSYPQSTTVKIESAGIVLTSDLVRSIESAELLNVNINFIADKLFKEAELPIPIGRFAKVKLKPVTWSIILRLLWLLGYSKDCESYRDVKNRAKIASELLIQYAQKYNSVVLVGHGFFNKLLAKELQRNGWSGKLTTSAKHWSCTTYTYK